MTSGANRTLREINSLAHRSKLLRVRTEVHPYAKVDLTLKQAKGMKRTYSWVGLKAFKIQLGTLGLYERQLGDYCLTVGSLKKLRDGIDNATVVKKPKTKKSLRAGVAKKRGGPVSKTRKGGKPAQTKKKKNVRRKRPQVVGIPSGDCV